MKILIFTDSRGQHKPAGSSHLIFGERLHEEYPEHEIDLILCPMKWTTTLDFLAFCRDNSPEQYDWIILYTGIVDWSPRPQKSAMHDLYNNANESNRENLRSNTNIYKEKIVNNKKNAFDSCFSEAKMLAHLNSTTGCIYEGQETINMYSVEMAKSNLGPILRDMKNLIFINSNRILPDWEGDYKRGRPRNMDLTHSLCDVISDQIPPEKLIDLRNWQRNEIQKFTCDNMHLTKAGSDWIYSQIISKLALEPKKGCHQMEVNFKHAATASISQLVNFGKIDRYVGGTKKKFMSWYPSIKHLATLIIGFRANSSSPHRLTNLEFLLKWIEHHYEDMFDVLIVEQDETPRIGDEFFKQHPTVRYEFIYNPNDYNRGWGYNVAVENYCNQSNVVVLMDTDVLPGNNFVGDIRDCHIGKFDVISPYQNVYYTSAEEAGEIFSSMSISHLHNQGSIKNPVTITGGIVIFKKQTFLDLKGFEQYIGYGCEDRALDAMITSLLSPERIKISPVAAIHLFHPSDAAARANFNNIYSHLTENYQCTYDPTLAATEYIHKNCIHASTTEMQYLLLEKHYSFADPDLYRYHGFMTVNGRTNGAKATSRSQLLPTELSNELNVSLNTCPPFIASINEAIKKHHIATATRLCRYASRYYPINSEMQPLVRLKKSEISIIGSVRDKTTCTQNSLPNFDAVNTQGKRTKTLVIMGNGPSLRHIDFNILKDVDTFGLNSAYRFYEELDFYPTYFGCFDNLVTTNHKESFQNLISDLNIPIKRFFFIQDFKDPLNRLTRIKFNNKILAEWKKRTGVSKSMDDYWIYENSGASATHAGIAMGYKKIILIGVDCSYVQIVEGAEQYGDKSNELIITTTPPENPNYWRNDYQVQGDVYHVPDAQKFQKPEWERLAANLFLDPDAADVDVYNCSPTTTLDCFEKANLADVLDINPQRLIDATTFLIKSFGRKNDIINLVRSIRSLYRNASIIVLDDSQKIDATAIGSIEDCGCKIILTKEFDIGLSEGRNRLVRNCPTKYMVLLDEDFVFSEHTDITRALKILATSSIDIVGGSVFDIGPDAAPHNQPRQFSGNIEITSDGTLAITPSESEPRYSDEGFLLTDLVLNFFVAKTESILKTLWDPDLKLAEHLDFFIRAKEANLNITYLKSMQVKHVQNYSASSHDYMEHRNRAREFNTLFKAKHEIKAIIKHGKMING